MKHMKLQQKDLAKRKHCNCKVAQDVLSVTLIY